MMNYKKLGKIASLAAITVLFSGASVEAAIANNQQQQIAIETTSMELPLELAQGGYCMDNYRAESLISFFETDNFYIYICGDTYDDMYYHGVGKDGSDIILEDVYAEEGTGYVAVNGNYTYIVNGAALSIYEGRILIQEDYVYQQ